MFTLNCRGRLLVVDKPLVMGIMNITPDSFYEGSRMRNTGQVLKQAEQMLNAGAAILDIGGQSTRPGSERLHEAEELQRVIDPIRALHDRFPEAILSIDTYSSKVAREAVAAGASIINDISGGQLDSGILTTAAELNTPYVLMHMKGTPETMQQNPQYDDVVQEVLDYFIAQTAACRAAGMNDIIIDPGFGFGKTHAHNFALLRQLSVLKMLRHPILLGVSRKGAIYKTLGITADEALNGTTVLHTIGLLNGAAILRAHDVREAVEVVKMIEAYLS